MTVEPFGTLLAGDHETICRSYEAMNRQPVDWDLSSEMPDPLASRQCTLARRVAVTGSGTFFGRAQRTLTIEPTDREGWWFERVDQANDLPTLVSVRNVWTTARNIVLRSGSPHNYMRMVEHIVALRLGMGIDNLVIKVDSGDPPLFDRGSIDLVEAIESGGVAEQPRPAVYVTVREPVSMTGPNGSFLILVPCDPARPALTFDCAVDFPNAIGSQRIRFNLTRARFRYGALARTNTTAAMNLYCNTVGKLFADIRNLGYTHRNILVAGKRRYVNEPEPLLNHDGKSLEAVWHRAMLDLLAALALIDQGRFLGQVVSYKAGHSLDVNLVRRLYQCDALCPVSRTSS